MHPHVVDGDSQLLGSDLRKNGHAALSDLDGPRQYRHFAVAIDVDCRRGSCRRARRLGDACKTFAGPNSIGVIGLSLSPADRLSRLEKSLFQSHALEAFAPIRKVA